MWHWFMQGCASHVLQPSRSARRPRSTGQSSFALITRDPSKRVTSACEQISSSMSLISSSVVGTHFIIVDTSPGPDAPFRTVAEVHDMARVVLLDLERRLPILPSSNRDDYCSIVRRTQTLKYFVRAPSGLLLAARCVHHLAGNGELSTHQQAPPSATGEALRPKFRAQGLALA